MISRKTTVGRNKWIVYDCRLREERVATHVIGKDNEVDKVDGYPY